MNKITQNLNFMKWPAAKRREFLFNMVLGIGFMVAFILLQNTAARRAVTHETFYKCRKTNVDILKKICIQ